MTKYGKKYVMEIAKARRQIESGEAKGTHKVARLYAAAKKDFVKGRIFQCEMDEVNECMQTDAHVCVVAAKMSVDSVPVGSVEWITRLDYLLDHTGLVEQLYRMSDVAIGSRVRNVLKQALRKQGRRVSDLMRCAVGSDMAWHGMPYVLPGGRVARLEELSASEVEQAVYCIQKDDPSPHDHVPMDGKAATDGLTGKPLRMEEVLEDGKLVTKLVILVTLTRQKIFVPVDDVVEVIRNAKSR